MGFQSFTSLFSLVALVPSAFAVLETTGDLVISNAAVSPDGFSRTAVLAGGGVVGELVTGNKVGINLRYDEMKAEFLPLSRAITSKSMLVYRFAGFHFTHLPYLLIGCERVDGRYHVAIYNRRMCRGFLVLRSMPYNLF